MILLPWRLDGSRYWRFQVNGPSVAACIFEESPTCFEWTVDPTYIKSPYESKHGRCPSLEEAKEKADEVAIEMGWKLLDEKLVVLA